MELNLSLSPADFLGRALGIPASVSEANAEALAERSLRELWDPEIRGTFTREKRLVERAVAALGSGSLDLLLADLASEPERRAAMLALVDGEHTYEGAATTLLDAITSFAKDHPFVSIARA